MAGGSSEGENLQAIILMANLRLSRLCKVAPGPNVTFLTKHKTILLPDGMYHLFILAPTL